MSFCVSLVAGNTHSVFRENLASRITALPMVNCVGYGNTWLHCEDACWRALGIQVDGEKNKTEPRRIA